MFLTTCGNNYSQLTVKEINDLLRFADILSKSLEGSNKDKANNISQSIVSMLHILHPENELVKYVCGSVLSNVNNYLGLDKNFERYHNRDLLECLHELIQREEFHIQGTDSSYFVNAQKLAYDRIKENSFYSFSAPTSMGKTFLIRMFIKEKVSKNEKKNFAIVVPSKALINEVSNSIIEDIGEELANKKYMVIQTPNTINSSDELNYIMVFTQERLLQFLIKNKEIKLSYVFIDEAHKMSAADERSPFFYKCIEILQSEHYGVKIVFSSPNIINPEVFLNSININGNKGFNRFQYSPVNQLKIIIDIPKQSGYIYNDLENKFIQVENNNPLPNTIEKIVYAVGRDKSNIVFCNSKKDAILWANNYTELVPDDYSENSSIQSLIRDIKEEIHPDCYLTKTLLKGVAYHVAYLPASIKEKIETLYRQKIIRTLFCTSTLLEGVNFPADNLFIKLSRKDSWLKEEQRVDFKNLIGRVGRIDFNLFGNVFCISDNDVNEQYKSAISEDIPLQKLSIEQLPDSKKREIVNLLASGKTVIEKKTSDTYPDVGFRRKILNILLKEVLDDRHGITFQSFEEYLSPTTCNQIKTAFSDNLNSVPDDLLATQNEIVKLDNAINSGLIYPSEVTYSNIRDFLNSLSDIFNWSKFEEKTDIGNKNRLLFFSHLVLEWVYGNTVKSLIEKAIEYATKNGVYYMYEEPHNRPYDDSLEQKNKIINETLDYVDKILQYKIPNYFLKFSDRYKEIKNIDEIAEDWYEYVEYGTTSKIVIKLQQLGLSRGFALYINKNKLYRHEGKKLKLDIEKIDERYSQELRRFMLNHSEYV